MRIILCRHGNTFGPDQEGGEKVFMCGSKNNIPLVDKGREQARIMASYLVKKEIIPVAIYANHLIRVWEFAAIIKEFIYNGVQKNIPLIRDERLLELDYGKWAGLTSEEVIDMFGKDAWDEWQNLRIIQNDSPHNWQVTYEQVAENIKSFFNFLRGKYAEKDTVLLIGSQGSITFTNILFAGGMEEAIKNDHYKIKTGRFSEIVYQNGCWQLLHWNLNPVDLF